ncbi:MAG: hypothetical protein Q9191_001414 [Dirinaria sp. TL-2023a]
MSDTLRTRKSPPISDRSDVSSPSISSKEDSSPPMITTTKKQEEENHPRISISTLDILRVLAGLCLLSITLSYFLTGTSILWGYRPAYTRPARIKAWLVCLPIPIPIPTKIPTLKKKKTNCQNLPRKSAAPSPSPTPTSAPTTAPTPPSPSTSPSTAPSTTCPPRLNSTAPAARTISSRAATRRARTSRAVLTRISRPI